MKRATPRPSRIVRAVLVVLLLGGFLSLILSWVSVFLADYSSVGPPPAAIDGMLWTGGYFANPPKLGFGPENENGHAWRFRYSHSMYGVKGTVLHGADLDRDVRLAWQPVLNDYASPDVLPVGSKGRSAPTAKDELGLPYPVINEIFTGWPMTAWKGEVRTDTQMTIQYRWSIPYTKRAPDFSGPAAVLPYKPLLLGLFVDSIVLGLPAYGVLLLAAWVMRLLRRARRHRRGLCPACGYAISDLDTCPECGEPVVRKSASEHA